MRDMAMQCQQCKSVLSSTETVFYLGVPMKSGIFGEVLCDSCANAPSLDSIRTGFLGWQLPSEESLQEYGLSQVQVQSWMYKLVNMTPHDVNIIIDGEVVKSIPPSGKVARVVEESLPDWKIGGLPVCRKVYGSVEVLDRADFLAKSQDAKVEPMPEPQDGVIFIVPMLVGQVLAGKRYDLVGPDYGIGGVRDKSGKISGAVGFIRY